MSVTDELISFAKNYAKQFNKGDLRCCRGARWRSSPAWTPGCCRRACSGSRRATRT